MTNLKSDARTENRGIAGTPKPEIDRGKDNDPALKDKENQSTPNRPNLNSFQT